MRARKYTKVIEFYRTVRVADGYGGFTIENEFIAKSWANIKSATNISSYSNSLNDIGINDPINTIVINLRHRNDLDYNAVDMLIKYNNRYYTIQNNPNNLDLENVDVQIIAVLQYTENAS